MKKIFIPSGIIRQPKQEAVFFDISRVRTILALEIWIFCVYTLYMDQAQQGDKEIQIGKYKVKVIRSLCIGAASCVAVAAATFQLDSENKAVVKPESNDTPDSILMAAQSCPTKAIIVVDTETGQQVWPA